MSKQEIRLEMKKLRRDLSPQDRERQNQDIRINLFQSEIWQEIAWFYPFVSYGTEVDTLSMITQAFSITNKEGQKIKVAVPHVEGQEMNFYEIHSLDELHPGTMGIPEPDVTTARKVIAEEGLMLIPGLAFGLNGGRIGYGGGYYDRYLAANGNSRLHTWAVAYDFQLLDYIPMEVHDISPEHIILPKDIV